MADQVLFAAMINQGTGGGGTNPYSSVLFTDPTHVDQIAVNDYPANCPQGSEQATVYISGGAHNNWALYISRNHFNTQTTYEGASGPVNGGSIFLNTHVNNNDASWNPVALVARNYFVNCIVGDVSPCYGTVICSEFLLNVLNSASSQNEYACQLMQANIGTPSHITNGRLWLGDWKCAGPIGVQPEIFTGLSLMMTNFYNGSPSFGAACGIAVQNLQEVGASINGATAFNNFPVDVGVFVGGQSTGGNHDGFTNPFQVGGVSSSWANEPSLGGDQGQYARGYVVSPRNNGKSVTRLGSFCSQGSGLGGALVFGYDVVDSSGCGIYRPTANTISISGQLNVLNQVTATGTTPANVIGKFPVYTSNGILFGYVPVFTAL